MVKQTTLAIVLASRAQIRAQSLADDTAGTTTKVFDALAYLNLYNATDQVYAIWDTANLMGSWSVQIKI